VTFICFIESHNSTTPHMEPLLADDIEAALEEAQRLMSQHTAPIAAHIFKEDRLVETLLQEDARA
jgi:hypothetical protein